MTARIIDGKTVAAALRARIAEQTAEPAVRAGPRGGAGRRQSGQRRLRPQQGPRGATVPGCWPKPSACPPDVSVSDLLAVIQRPERRSRGGRHPRAAPVARGPSCLVRSSRPSIPAKDVDGFHPLNVGRLQDGLDVLAPCTPTGVMRLLEAVGTSRLRGARAVVLGRSAIVGKPMADPAAGGRRHGDHRAFPHGGSSPRSAGGPTFWWQRWAGPRWCAATGSSITRR